MKLTKVGARYIELEQFKDSDHHRGYFCYNCVYFMKPNHCAIVTDEGVDIMGHSSNIIAPHGICGLWMPNQREIHDDTASKSDESTPGVSAMFSCETCNRAFTTRQELRQHTIQEHRQ
jgi:hypothetical protein